MNERIRVLVAGEGKDDIGDSYSGVEGVVQALLRCVDDGAWIFVRTRTWKSIRKFKAGEHRSAETRNVLGLLQDARDDKVHAIAFVRDRDGDAQRECEVAKGMDEVVKTGEFHVIGGVAIESIDAWVLACCGDHKAEGYKKPKAVLDEVHGVGTRASKVDRVRSADPSTLPKTAKSLHAWLGRARAVAQHRA